ncbi:hypothetical protein CVT26_011793 [Gymnopilus dilepis]|uniref:Uncharacterized protein n=1 Tax=Gymnopilus dilepis TaxID=231916 RepID=A0A409WUB6_9AGAR|nr:hypothetical protein CVT26_011793 [Gymnopilus dilepis]
MHPPTLYRPQLPRPINDRSEVTHSSSHRRRSKGFEALVWMNAPKGKGLLPDSAKQQDVKEDVPSRPSCATYMTSASSGFSSFFDVSSNRTVVASGGQASAPTNSEQDAG